MGRDAEQKRPLLYANSYAALEGALGRELARVRAGEPLAPVLVLVPTNLLRRHLMAQAAAQGGHINVHFLTLLDLATRLGEGPLLRRGLSPAPVFGDEVIARAVCRTTPCGYFASIADRPGFHRALLATVTDLKEARHRPADLADAIGRLPQAHQWLAPRLEALLTLWRAYETRLDELALHDRNDVFAAAVAAAASDPWLSSLAAVFVYGFYDFNGLQMALVTAATAERPGAVFAPIGPEPEAADLFSRGFRPKRAPAPPLPAELAALSDRLFEPVTGDPCAGGQTLRIVSAPDEVREVHAVLRAACQAAAEGTPLTRVGVLLRRTDDYAGLFAEACEVGGLEAYHHDPPALAASRAGRSLLLLLRLWGSEFPRADVMDFAGYADIPFEELVAGEDAAEPADWDLLSRDAGVVKGVEQWRRNLARLRRRLAGDADEDETARQRLSALDGLVEFLDALFDGLASPPAATAWAGLTEAALAIYRRFVRESAERRAVEDVVAELSALDATGEPADPACLISLAREALESRRPRSATFGAAGPVIVDLMEGRGLPFDVVFVPGVVERGFPAAPHIDPLLSDRERAPLCQVGLRLPMKSLRGWEERLVFRLAVGAARERVVLSYPRLDPASGRERVPSHFLLRAVEAATGQRCDYARLSEFAGFERVAGPSYAPAEPEQAWHPAGYDLAVVQRAVASRSGAEVGYLASVSPTFAAALRAEQRRWGERRFTEYDGVLASEAARAALAERLGPMPWNVSATALESYASCPFRYFLERVLGVAPLEEPEAVRRLTALDRGSLLHGILHQALRLARADGWLPLRAEHQELVLEIAREALDRFEAEGLTGLPALWRLEREGLELELRRFVLDEASEGEAYVPAHFEVCFGLRPHHGEDELGSPEGIVLELEGDLSVRVRGRIDRIDVRPSDGSARVLDYKTGSAGGAPKADSFAGGSALQLPLYLRAAQALLGDAATVDLAAYRFITERGGYRAVGFSRSALEERADELTSILATIASGIASGRFFAGLSGEGCRFCGHKGVCGVGAGLTARFKADDAVARAYLEMREIE